MIRGAGFYGCGSLMSKGSEEIRCVHKRRNSMSSFIDFLVAEARKKEWIEHVLLYAGVAVFVFFVFFLRFMFG